MNKEIYILVGISVFAFIIGHKLRQKFNKSPQKLISKNNKKGRSNAKSVPSVRSGKEKLKTIFIYIQLLIVFGLLIFMIPALSRDILSNKEVYDQNLVLRMVIVAFSIYILFMGFLKLRKTSQKKEQ